MNVLASILLFAQEGGHAEEPSGTDLILPEVGELIWGAVAFALVLFILNKFAFPKLRESVEEREKKKYQGVLQDGLRRLSEAGWTTARGEVVTGEAVDEIKKYALQIRADLIVVGHKHLDSWAARWWRGSVSGALIEHAPCSVLCVITR